MLNLMEDERNKQVSEEQIYKAKASEKHIENAYKPRSLLFERQPTRYAWFSLDSSENRKERGEIWKKTNKHNVAQNIYGSQTSGDVPLKTIKRSNNTNSLPWNKITKYNANESETNITCTKERTTRKRNVQKANETGIRCRNKRIHLKEENLVTKVVLGQESNCQDKNEITKDAVTLLQVAKTTEEESLKLEDTMEHRKNSPLTETQNYIEHSEMTNTITSVEQHSEAHLLGAKSSDSSDKPTETKHDKVKHDAMKLCTSPEPADINNHLMNVTETVILDKSERTVIPQSHCLDTNNEKYIISNDSKENRIFGTASDNLSALNTEAVKFSFGSSTTDTPYKESIVFSARDRHRNKNEADIVKQNTLKLRKPEETAHTNINTINECHARVQAIRENVVVSNQYLSQEEKDDIHVKQNCSKEILSQSTMPSTNDKYDIQRQNDVTVDVMVEKEMTECSQNENISNHKHIPTLNENPDGNAENTETICKTCLALQAAEKFNYKCFSVVIDTLTEVNQKNSKGDLIYSEKQDAEKTDSQKFTDKTVSAMAEQNHFTDTQNMINDTAETVKCVRSAQKIGLKTDSQKFTDETVCGKTETQHFTEIEKCISSGLVTTKTEQVLSDDTTVSSSADTNLIMEAIESSSIPNILQYQHDLVEPKSSGSSENFQVVENHSQASVESLETDKQTKVKKHKHGWLSRLFSKLHKRKSKKVIECDIVSTPSKSGS